MYRGFFIAGKRTALVANRLKITTVNMKKIKVGTNCRKLLSDIYTPVGIYLRLRDRFRDTVLLESTDYHVAENSYSFICINAIAGIEISDTRNIEFKLPGQPPETKPLANLQSTTKLLWE